MLIRILQAQLPRSKAVACRRMRLLRQPSTVQSAYAGSHRASAASSLQGCGTQSHAVAYATWHSSVGLYWGLCWLAVCKRSFLTARRWRAVACGCLCNPAQLIVTMPDCLVQVQLLHSMAGACCRMRSLMQPGIVRSAYDGLYRSRAASHQQSCGILSHMVA